MSLNLMYKAHYLYYVKPNKPCHTQIFVYLKFDLVVPVFQTSGNRIGQFVWTHFTGFWGQGVHIWGKKTKIWAWKKIATKQWKGKKNAEHFEFF